MYTRLWSRFVSLLSSCLLAGLAQPLAAQAPAGPLANDFALYYRHDIRTGCPDARCVITPAQRDAQIFTEDNLPDGDTGTRLLTNGASASGGRAGFSGAATSFLPAMSVYAFSEAFTRVQNTFAGVQRYTVETGVTSLTLNGALTFSAGGFPGFFPPDMSGQGVVFGGLFVWESDSNVLDFGDCNFHSPDADATVICFTGGSTLDWPSVRRLGDVSFDNASPTGSLTVDGLTAGREIFVGAWVTTVAAFGGFVDARNTVRLSFGAPDVATAAFQQETFGPAELPAPVPEPSTWSLLVVAALGIALRQRRTS